MAAFVRSPMQGKSLPYPDRSVFVRSRLLDNGVLAMATQTYSRIRGASQQTQEAERLLARYPRLAPSELARLIEIFPTVLLIDKAIIIADDQLSKHLAAFHHDHGEKPTVSSAALWLFLILPIVTASRSAKPRVGKKWVRT